MKNTTAFSDSARRYLDYLPWEPKEIGLIQIIIADVDRQYEKYEHPILPWGGWKYVLPRFINFRPR